jgi:hypothetical protein
MDDQHIQELADFDSSFPESLPRHYSRLSPHLLNLRERQKHLVLSRRYHDAVPVREQANQREEEELDIQRGNLIRDFEARRGQLIDRLNGQTACFEKNWARKRARFEIERDRELDGLKKAVANVESKIEFVERELAANGIDARQTPRAAPSPCRAKPVPSPAKMNPRMRNVAAATLTRRSGARRS